MKTYLNVKSDSFALASEVIWVSFLRVKTVAKYSCCEKK